MRIVLFTDTIGDLNGVSRFLQDIAELALRRGDDLHIIASTKKSCPQAENIHNFSPTFTIPIPFYKELDLAFPPHAKLEAFVMRDRPDLIHISTPGPVGLAGRKIAKKLGIPILGTYHTDFPAYMKDNTGSKWLKQLTDRWMARFHEPFVHTFSRSKIYAEIMQKDLGIPVDKISYIRAGTNLQRFASKHADKQIWRTYGLEEHSFKILYVGRITKEKNVPYLLDVWGVFKERYPKLNAELVLVGEGALKKRALRMRPMGVHYIGPVVGEALSKVYASSDLFVFPSQTDTLGQVVMESSASALPVMVSKEGGPKSLVSISPRSGYVLDIDANTWAEQMADIYEDKGLRASLGESAENYMQAFPIEASYEDFIGGHREIYTQ